MIEKLLDPDQIQSPYRQSSAAPATGGEIAVVLQLLDRVEPEGLLGAGGRAASEDRPGARNQGVGWSCWAGENLLSQRPRDGF